MQKEYFTLSNLVSLISTSILKNFDKNTIYDGKCDSNITYRNAVKS